MDSLSQIALGITTAEVCAGSKLRNKTFLYGAVLGTIPDLDILVGKFMSDVQGVAIHRGLSHSLLFFLFLSPLLGTLLHWLEKDKISKNRSIFLVFACLTTHVLLDLFTSWGTQIFWPLEHRIAWKTIFVVDPLYTIPLLVSLVFVWKSKNLESRNEYLYRGLLISTAYLFMTVGLKLFALQKFEKALEEQMISFDDIIVKPTAFNTILWNANVAVEEGYLLGYYSLLDSQPIDFIFYPKNSFLDSTLTDNDDFKCLQKISEGWYILSSQNGMIFFNDLRFGLLIDSPDNPQFAFSYEFVPQDDGSVIAVEVPKAKRDGKALLKKLFVRLLGN
jgi:inner membrane protein